MAVSCIIALYVRTESDRTMNHLTKYVFLTSAILAYCEAAGTCNSPDADVLILGAGFSGVAAAKTLFDAGMETFSFWKREMKSAVELGQ